MSDSASESRYYVTRHRDATDILRSLMPCVDGSKTPERARLYALDDSYDSDDPMYEITVTIERIYPTPVCIGCGRNPSNIVGLIEYARNVDMTPDEYVREEDGTYNQTNGHFACDTCYVEMGMPFGPNGWKAP